LSAINIVVLILNCFIVNNKGGNRKNVVFLVKQHCFCSVSSSLHQIFNILSFISKNKDVFCMFWRKQGFHITWLCEENKSIKLQSWHEELNCHVCSFSVLLNLK